MKTMFLTGLLGASLLLTPGFAATKKAATSGDMKQAIAFERNKAAADARQSRIEARHPSAARADRSANRSVDQGRKVKDPGEPATRKK
ncbi:MAG: hypothetical protein LAP87_09115 [Acidobacteriia bacterium]|nr:hypothetical protein [Terriglobia bacterium]